MSDEKLLERFVASFGKLDDLLFFGDRTVLPAELGAGVDDSLRARPKWKPVLIQSERGALDEIYKVLPATFPPLYEQLAISYRWLEVDLQGFVQLFANPPGPSLSGLLSRITADRVSVDVLFPLGFIPFGSASGGSYDPICFDTARRRGALDCPVVRIEHEAVLCEDRVGKSFEIAVSFRSFVEAVVAKSEG